MNTQEQNSRMIALDAEIKAQHEVLIEAQNQQQRLLAAIAPLAATAQVGQVIVKKTGTHAGKRMRVIALVPEFSTGRVWITHVCVVLRKDGSDSDNQATARSYDGIEVQS